MASQQYCRFPKGLGKGANFCFPRKGVLRGGGRCEVFLLMTDERMRRGGAMECQAM